MSRPESPVHHPSPIRDDEVDIVGVPFVKEGMHLDGGDFDLMITMSEYNNTLFLFNGNVMDDLNPKARHGAGSACIRPYSTSIIARACGIPTGWMPGRPFERMESLVAMAIDDAITRAANMINLAGYTRVVFPADSTDTMRLGTSVFGDMVGDDVLEYIEKRIQTLADPSIHMVMDLDFSYTRRHYYMDRFIQERRAMVNKYKRKRPDDIECSTTTQLSPSCYPPPHRQQSIRAWVNRQNVRG